MMMEEANFLVVYRNCAACEESIQESFLYCPHCGEKQPDQPELELWFLPWDYEISWPDDSSGTVTTRASSGASAEEGELTR